MDKIENGPGGGLMCGSTRGNHDQIKVKKNDDVEATRGIYQIEEVAIVDLVCPKNIREYQPIVLSRSRT
jgi:hypothetical protein